MIHYWAVLVSAVAAMIIGSIWWGPLFGKMWIRENGLDKGTPEQQEQMKKGMGMLYFQQFVLSFIQGWVIAYVLNVAGSMSAAEGLKWGAILWAGFLLPVHYGNKLWGNKSFTFITATLGSSLVTNLAMALILVLWK